MHEYEFELSVNLEGIFPKAKKLTDSINGFMNDMGFPEKMHIRSNKGLSIRVTSDRALLKEEINTMSNLIETTFKEFKDLHAVVENVNLVQIT